MILEIEKNISSGELHPKDAKMKLAFEVTSAFYGDVEAEDAEKDFIVKFQKKSIPDEIPEFSLPKKPICLDVLVDSGLVASRSQGRRMIEQKAVKLDGETIVDWDCALVPGVLQVGKRKFIRLL